MNEAQSSGALRGSRTTRLRSAGLLALLVFAMSLISACGNRSDDSSLPAGSGPSESQVAAEGRRSGSACQVRKPRDLVPVVERRIPHDPSSYVQGLLLADGVLYESAGRYGESRLSILGQDDGSALSQVKLPDDVFAEGLALGSDGELVQLTWKEGVAFRWPVGQIRPGGKPSGEFKYDGEGWGLTTLTDGTLVMSDGSNRLTLRDPVDFSVIESHEVARSGGPADQLNELDFDGTSVWANRYQSTEILRIDPECWTVTGVVDAESLRSEAERTASSKGERIDVLNGIAHIPGGEKFFVTGKWWPMLFEVRFVERP